MKRADVEGLAHDLLHIEVLTFVVDSIDVRFRRVDESALEELRATMSRAVAEEDTPAVATTTFGDLGKQAAARSDELGQRVAHSADRVQEIVRGSRGSRSLSSLAPHERIELRRILEVGTHRCAARTVISLSGDVTNHLNADFVDNASIQAAHHRAVQTAVSVWDDLVRTLTSFLGTVISGIFGK